MSATGRARVLRCTDPEANKQWQTTGDIAVENIWFYGYWEPYIIYLYAHDFPALCWFTVEICKAWMSLEQFWKLLLTFGGDSLLCLWSNARRLSRYTTSGAWEPRDFVSQLIQYQWVRRNILQPLRTRKTNHIIVFLRPWIVGSSL